MVAGGEENLTLADMGECAILLSYAYDMIPCTILEFNRTSHDRKRHGSIETTTYVCLMLPSSKIIRVEQKYISLVADYRVFSETHVHLLLEGVADPNTTCFPC